MSIEGGEITLNGGISPGSPAPPLHALKTGGPYLPKRPGLNVHKVRVFKNFAPDMSAARISQQLCFKNHPLPGTSPQTP